MEDEKKCMHKNVVHKKTHQYTHTAKGYHENPKGKINFIRIGVFQTILLVHTNLSIMYYLLII